MLDNRSDVTQIPEVLCIYGPKLHNLITNSQTLYTEQNRNQCKHQLQLLSLKKKQQPLCKVLYICFKLSVYIIN